MLPRMHRIMSIRCSVASFQDAVRYTSSFDIKAASYDTPAKVARSAWVAKELRSQPWFSKLHDGISSSSSSSGSKHLTALDVGAGTGLLTFEMAPHFGHVTAFDVSNKMLDVMKSKLSMSQDSDYNYSHLSKRVTPTLGPLHQLGRFDVIFSLLAFHHVKDVEGLVRTLRENHLHQGGRLVVVDLEATKNARRFHRAAEQVGNEYEWDGFSEEIMRGWFESGRSGCFRDLHLVRRPFMKKLDTGWGEKEDAEEQYSMLFVSAVKS